MHTNNRNVVLITGATGALGPRVVFAFRNAGYQVRTFSIDKVPTNIFPPGTEIFVGDVTDPAALNSAMQGVDAVVHMAALLHMVNPPAEMRGQYERVNVGGTAKVVEAAMKVGVGRIVFLSTIAVYGASNGHVLNEMSPTNPDTFYAQTKCIAEQIVLNAKNANGIPLATVLRLSAVYGPRIKGNYERLTHALAQHRFIPIGKGRNRRTLIYDKDVARAIVLALSHPAAAGKVYNVSDGEYHTVHEIIESICAALGRTSPMFSLPLGLMQRLTENVDKSIRFFAFKSPATKSIIEKYTEDIVVDGSLIQRELGFVPEFNLKNGWEETIREMQL